MLSQKPIQNRQFRQLVRRTDAPTIYAFSCLISSSFDGTDPVCPHVLDSYHYKDMGQHLKHKWSGPSVPNRRCIERDGDAVFGDIPGAADFRIEILSRFDSARNEHVVLRALNAGVFVLPRLRQRRRTYPRHHASSRIVLLLRCESRWRLFSPCPAHHWPRRTGRRAVSGSERSHRSTEDGAREPTRAQKGSEGV